MYKKNKSKISPCFVHFRETAFFNHMRMMYHPRTGGCYQSQMLSGGIITTLDARRCEFFFFKKGGERSKSERGGRKNTAMMLKLFHVTQGLLHPHHPRHRWLTEDGQSELLCLGSSTDAPTAVRTSCVR